MVGSACCLPIDSGAQRSVLLATAADALVNGHGP